MSPLRQTQWDPPTWDSCSDNTSVDHESEMDLGTPTYDENPSKVSVFRVRLTFCLFLRNRVRRCRTCLYCLVLRVIEN